MKYIIIYFSFSYILGLFIELILVPEFEEGEGQDLFQYLKKRLSLFDIHDSITIGEIIFIIIYLPMWITINIMVICLIIFQKLFGKVLKYKIKLKKKHK